MPKKVQINQFVKGGIGGGYRNRTDLHGFAIQRIACLPTRLTVGFISFHCCPRQPVSDKYQFLFCAVSVHARFSRADRACMIRRVSPAYLRTVAKLAWPLAGAGGLRFRQPLSGWRPALRMIWWHIGAANWPGISPAWAWSAPAHYGQSWQATR